MGVGQEPGQGVAQGGERRGGRQPGLQAGGGRAKAAQLEVVEAEAGGLVEDLGVLQVLKKLFEVTLDRAVSEALWRCAFCADGGAPDLVDMAYAFGGREVWPADAGFEGVKISASAF